MRSKTQHLLIILLSIGIVVSLSVAGWALFFRSPAAPLPPDYVPEEWESNTLPVEETDTRLNVPEGGGGISLEYVPSVTIDLSDKKAYFAYTNPAKSTQNIILCIEVKDTPIAQSGLIAPGNRLAELALFEGVEDRLSQGIYTEAQFRILSYDPITGEKAMVDTLAEITVTVQP